MTAPRPDAPAPLDAATLAVRPAAIGFIFISVVLDVLALGIIIPVLPKLVEGFMGGNTAQAALVYGVFGTAWAVMQFFFAPFLGALSDRYGRRPIMLISALGLGLDYLFMAVAPSLAWLFVGRVISGITSASFSTAFAYIADVTPPEQRAARFGLVGAAFGLGFVLGPALGGVLGSVDARLPFWVAGALCLLNFCYGYFVLPESLPKERRMPFSWRRANPIGALALLRSQPQLAGFAWVGFLVNLAHGVLPSVTVLYMGYRYGWSERDVGFMLAGVGVCSMIVQGALVKPVVKRLGEARALVLGLSFGALGLAIYGLATVGWVFLIGVPVMSLWGFATPSLQGLMSRRVSGSEQGQLQGANASVNSVAALVGPGLFTGTFAYFIDAAHRPAGIDLSGAPFLLAAALLLGAALYSRRVIGAAQTS